jgi:hypothetical protein
MPSLSNLSLIHLFDFYLVFMFAAGTIRRIDQYLNIGRLVVSGPGRWPKLLALVAGHRMLFLTWTTVLPALLALLLTVVQLVASRMIWPEAGTPPSGLTWGRLAEYWPALMVIVPFGLVMLVVDAYGILVVGVIPRAELEKHFDQAEYWLGSRTASVVRVFTIGFVNPRRMVATEVRKALIAASRLLNTTLWWVIVQNSLRIAFGLSLWMTWALTRD